METHEMTGAHAAREAGAHAARPLVVAVVGSRSVRPATAGGALLQARLNRQRMADELAEVVSGGAGGADAVAAAWARAWEVPLTELRPDYGRHGNAAPHVRNAAVVEAADLVLVVWDGQSRGTLSAARHARRLGVPCEWLLAAAPPDLAPEGGEAGAQLGLW